MRLAKLNRILCAAVLTGGGVLASVALLPSADANSVDPSTPATLVVGKPRGHAISDRVGPRRLGQARAQLPRLPKARWRIQLPAGLDLAPVINSKGDIFAAMVSPEIVKIDAAGKQKWLTSLGSGAATSSPVITSDGSVVVVTSDGKLWKVSAGGNVRFEIDLRARTKARLATPLAFDDGSVIVATERQLIHVASDGAIRSRARTPARPSGGLIQHKKGTLVTTQSGKVLLWKSPAAPRQVGDFGGSPAGGAALVSDRHLVAVVGRVKLVVVDLLGGSNTVLAHGGIGFNQIDGPIAFEPQSGIVITTVMGELFAYDAHGVVHRQVPLENLAMFASDAGPPTGMFNRFSMRPSPPPIIDVTGYVAFVRANGRLGIVDNNDFMTLLDPRVCSRPFAILPAGKGRMLVVCRSGGLSFWSD